MGRNCLREVLRAEPARLVKIYTVRKDKRSDSASEILELASKHHISTEELDYQKLSALVQSESHQSFVALVRDREALNLKSFIASSAEKDRSLILAIDGLNDPQNLGALLRAAECFGADAVLWSKNRLPGITPAVAKASVGASELIPNLIVSNLADALGKLKDGGFWVVVADVGEDSKSLSEFEFPQKCVLVMGAEGEGVKALIRKNADFLLRIPMCGRIESLNVSQAATLLLFAYRQTFAS